MCEPRRGSLSAKGRREEDREEERRIGEIMAVIDINSPGNHVPWIRDYWYDLAAKAYA
jgi:hypothetical protein